MGLGWAYGRMICEHVLWAWAGRMGAYRCCNSCAVGLLHIMKCGVNSALVGMLAEALNADNLGPKVLWA